MNLYRDNIELFFGPVGSGKSFSAVEQRVMRSFSHGLHVYTNFKINIEATKLYLNAVHCVDVDVEKLFHLLSEDDVLHLHQIIPRADPRYPIQVIIDEAHLWFNSRKWDKTDHDFLSWLSQTRKGGVDFVFIVQNPSSLDKQIRGQVVMAYSHQDMRRYRLGFLRYPFPQITQQALLKDLRTPNGPSTTFYINPMLFKCYESYDYIKQIPGSNPEFVKPLPVKRTGFGTRYYFRMLRMSHVLIFLVATFFIAIGCSRIDKKKLNEDIKTVQQLKADLQSCIEQFKVMGYTSMVNHVTSEVSSSSISSDQSIYPNELYDGSLIVKEVRRWGGGKDQFEVILSDGRILRHGMFFHRGLMVVGVDDYRLTVWSLADGKERFIPIALYDSVSTNFPSI